MGVSEGKLVFANEEGESFAHMTGRVSTENNGGFIQFRTPVKKGEKGTTTQLAVWFSKSVAISSSTIFTFELPEPYYPGSITRLDSRPQTSGKQ